MPAFERRAAIDWSRVSHRDGVGLRLLALYSNHPKFSTTKNFIVLPRRNHALGGERSGEFVAAVFGIAVEKAAATDPRRNAAVGHRSRGFLGPALEHPDKRMSSPNHFSSAATSSDVRPVRGFFTSGILHEWVINVPLYIVTGKKYFGLMTLYFLLQAVGILIEHQTRHRSVRIFLVWLFVFGAAPLMINEGMLRILHLWPG